MSWGTELAKLRRVLRDPDGNIWSDVFLRHIYNDIQQGSLTQNIIANFLFTLANSIIAIAKKHNYKHIALSGGVFQNTTLVDMLIALTPKEIKLYFHKDLSPNDENISFGQIMYYLKITNHKKTTNNN